MNLQPFYFLKIEQNMNNKHHSGIQKYALTLS